MKFFLDRLNEPSTHAGIAAIAQAAKFIAPQWSFLFDATSIIFGGVAAIKKG